MPTNAVEVPLGKLDTLTAAEALPLGDFTVLNNVSSQTNGVYTKRFGWTALASGPSGIIRLAGLGAQLLALTATDCYSYNAATAAWYDNGTVSSAQTSQKAIALDQTQNLIISTRATAGNVTAHFWIRNGTVYYELRSVTDDAIMATAVADNSATFAIIHAVAVGQFIFAAWVDNATQVIRGVKVDSTTGSITAAATILSGANVFVTGAYLDVAPLSSTECYIANVSNTPNVKVRRFNVATFTTTITSGNLSGADGIGPGSGIAVMGTAGESGYVMYSDNAGNVRVTTFDPTSTILSAGPSTVGVTVGTNRENGLVRYDSTHALAVWNDVTAAPASTTRWALIDNATAVTSTTSIPSTVLISKPWTYSGNYYVNVWAPFRGTASTNPGNQSFYTIRIGLSPYVMVATHAYRSSYINSSTAGMLTDVDTVSAGVFAFNAPVAYKFLSTTTPRAGVFTFGIDFASSTRGLPVEANGEAYFANGVVKHFDGVRPSEANFLAYPEIITATPGAVGGSGMDDGTYSYIAVYETADANGNVDRSTTSLAVSATTVAGAGLGKVTVTITHLQMTAVGWAGLQQGNISLFRTKAAGTTYFYVGQAAMDPTAVSVSILDQANDSTIGSNRILYTTGGVLDREPPPPAMQLLTHRNRVWGISSADRKLLFYSGEMQPGEGVWFSSAQQVRVEGGGDIVAIASLDDKLIVRTQDHVYFIVGDPPNQLGQNSSLQPPQLIMADTGGSDPFHVSLPIGLLWRTNKGYKLLDRSLNLQFLGEPDAYFQAYPHTRAATVEADKHEARFDIDNGVEDGIKLVYNYRDNRWTTFSNYNFNRTISAAMVGGVYHYSNASSTVYFEDTSTYLDAGSNYVTVNYTTGWMRLTSRQGLARLQRVLMKGLYHSAHDVSVSLAGPYFATGTPQPKTYTNAQIVASSTFPSEQLPLHVRAQKGEAWQLSIADAYNAGTLGNGRGFTFHGLTLLTGQKTGTFEKQMTTAVKG